MQQPVQVYIIDDDASICTAYSRLVRSARMEAHTFSSVEQFLASSFSTNNGCVISDVRMPGTNGLELPRMLARNSHSMPVILVTAVDSPETRETAIRNGVSSFFRKPVDDQALLDAISWALGNHPSQAPIQTGSNSRQS